jgi:hypothetical protein
MAGACDEQAFGTEYSAETDLCKSIFMLATSLLHENPGDVLDHRSQALASNDQSLEQEAVETEPNHGQ